MIVSAAQGVPASSMVPPHTSATSSPSRTTAAEAPTSSPASKLAASAARTVSNRGSQVPWTSAMALPLVFAGDPTPSGASGPMDPAVVRRARPKAAGWYARARPGRGLGLSAACERPRRGQVVRATLRRASHRHALVDHSAHTTSTGWKNRRTRRLVSVSSAKASVPSVYWAMLPGKNDDEESGDHQPDRCPLAAQQNLRQPEGCLVGGHTRPPEVLSDGAQRHERPGIASGHRRPVVRHRQQDRDLVTNRQLTGLQPVLHQTDQAFRLQGCEEHDLGLDRGLLGRQQRGDPRAGYQIDDGEAVRRGLAATEVGHVPAPHLPGSALDPVGPWPARAGLGPRRWGGQVDVVTSQDAPHGGACHPHALHIRAPVGELAVGPVDRSPLLGQRQDLVDLPAGQPVDRVAARPVVIEALAGVAPALPAPHPAPVHLEHRAGALGDPPSGHALVDNGEQLVLHVTWAPLGNRAAACRDVSSPVRIFNQLSYFCSAARTASRGVLESWTRPERSSRSCPGTSPDAGYFLVDPVARSQAQGTGVGSVAAWRCSTG